MKHLHKASGLEFECGELLDFPVNGIRRTYDMTVITLWKDSEESLEPPVIVDYYFGEYNAEHTDYYIDRWLERQAMDRMWRRFVGDCRDIVAAYQLTNEGCLDEATERKVRTVHDGLNNLLEEINYEH